MTTGREDLLPLHTAERSRARTEASIDVHTANSRAVALPEDGGHGVSE
jgi:hypothetical protein